MTIYSTFRSTLKAAPRLLGLDIRRNPQSVGGIETDGCIVYHNSSFLNEKAFHTAYSEALERCGDSFKVPWRLHVFLWSVASTQGVQGDIVELGTGAGFNLTALFCHPDRQMLVGNREVWSYDSFLPYSVDDVTGTQNSAAELSPYYANGVEQVKHTIPDSEQIRFIVGQLPDSLEKECPSKISLLHVDLNHHKAEIASLEFLWETISPGAVILLDDYANRGAERQFSELNNFASRVGRKILSLPVGSGIMIK